MLLAQQALRYGFALVSFYLFVCLTVCMCYCLPVAQLKVPPLSLRELLKQQAQCVIWEDGVPVFKALGQQNVFFFFCIGGTVIQRSIFAGGHNSSPLVFYFSLSITQTKLFCLTCICVTWWVPLILASCPCRVFGRSDVAFSVLSSL